MTQPHAPNHEEGFLPDLDKYLFPLAGTMRSIHPYPSAIACKSWVRDQLYEADFLIH
ncbi:hypothetical protein D3C75_624790 [compost metagenome]